MEKNEELIGIISDVGINGEGVLKHDGKTVFVPFTLKGEKVRCKILKVTSKCAYAKVLEIYTPSDIRVKPKCAVFGKCGGCQLQHIKYNSQLRVKENNIATTFKKVANINVSVSSAVVGTDCYRYRNKLQIPVSASSNGAAIGFYAEGSHRVVPIDDCLINAPWTADIISAFKQYIEEFDIKGYDEADNSGEVREITVKEIKGNLLITVVTLSEKIRGKDRLVDILKEKVKYTFSLYLNVNSKNTNVIYGDKFVLLYGKPDYCSEMLGVKYKIGVQSFMQVNDSVCAKLYSTVKKFVSADNQTVVIDAYSGAGLMTALLAKDAKKAIGIELVPEAVECANELALMNKLNDKVSNYQGKCEDILPDIIKREKENNEKICLILDPPRKGCDIEVINAIIKSDIEKIIYVSCLPSTLARDVGLIVGTLECVNGEVRKVENPKYRYDVAVVKPFDMFAQTKHVETLVCLTRVNHDI